jgi:hypothetical protein
VGESVNSMVVLGRDLLLVEVGGGAETHLAETTTSGPGRAAVETERLDPESARYTPTAAGYDVAALEGCRWEATTLCGRTWLVMAAGESGALRRGQETSLTPTCRSCLRVMDTWFPSSDAPAGVQLLAEIIAEKVEEFGTVRVTSIPAEHVEDVRRAARKSLRAKGFRSTTHVLGDVLHVLSDDATAAIDPGVKHSWINAALSGITIGVPRDDTALSRAREPIDWRTWVIDV